MQRTRSRTISAFVALATFTTIISGALVTSASAAGTPPCASVGCWTKPFSPFGLYDNAPPQTPAAAEVYPAAASQVMMPDGRIIYWNGLQNIANCGQISVAADAGKCLGNAKSEILDLRAPTSDVLRFVPVAVPAGNHDDLFCSDQRLLESGHVLDTGGTYWTTEEPSAKGTGIPGADGLAELYGSKNTREFNGTSWTTYDTTNLKDLPPGYSPTMHEGRWYPTMLTLPSGDQFVAGGVTKLLWNSSIMTQIEDATGNTQYEQATFPLPENTQTTEIWSLAHRGWKQNPVKDNIELPLFARLHLLPNGEIFFSSNGQQWGPAGESINELNWNNMLLFDPSKVGQASDQGWRHAGMFPLGATSGAAEVMMPIDAANPNKVQILVAGGALGVAPDTYLAQSMSQMITLTKSGSSWTTSVAATGDLNNRRWFSSSVLLPNGQVAVFNGADKDEVILPGSEMPVHQAELFDPTTNKWTPLSSSGRDRTYHNSAILLPDGSILVGGHAPINQGYGGTGNSLPLDTLGFVHNLKDPSFERFYPPYLYADGGSRPKISESTGEVSWTAPNNVLHVTVPSGESSVDHFVLTRLPAQTHITDADARTVKMGHGSWNGDSATLTIPDNPALLPPGYYYLFAISKKGVPSVAPIIQVADPHYFQNKGSASPIQLEDQTANFRNASQAVVGLARPAAAAHAAPKAAPAAKAGTVATLDDTVIPVSTPSKPARAPSPWLYVAAALLGGALIRPLRRFARR